MEPRRSFSFREEFESSEWHPSLNSPVSLRWRSCLVCKGDLASWDLGQMGQPATWSKSPSGSVASGFPLLLRKKNWSGCPLPALRKCLKFGSPVCDSNMFHLWRPWWGHRDPGSRYRPTESRITALLERYWWGTHIQAGSLLGKRVSESSLFPGTWLRAFISRARWESSPCLFLVGYVAT